MDFEFHLILIYCICDDCVKMLRIKDDPQCKMSTAEIMTIAIASAQFFYGNFRRSRLVLQHGRFMKHILSESQLNRRWHAIDENLWYTVFYLLAEINKQLRLSTNFYAVDSFPLPVCQRGRSYRCKLYKGKQFLGYCKSKRLHYYGLKVHVIVTEFGTICGFYITSGSESDIRALEKYELPLPRDSILTADKAYTSYELEDLLLEKDGISLLPLRRKNLSRQHDPLQKRVIKSIRKIVETTISCIQGLFPKAIVAKTSKGFELKLLMFLLAKGCTDYAAAA
jgi:Transposase DDE domain